MTPPRQKLPPLKALLAFEAASRQDSFAKGALELGVTPSAVSHQIQVLEEFLGVKLFQRRAGRAVLTPAGMVYSRELEQAFGIIGKATTLVAPQSQHGHLVIASGPSFAAKWLQPRLPDFLSRHPEVRIRLSTLSGMADLDDSRFDIAIAYALPAGTARDAEPLVTEMLRPLCSPALAARLDLRSPGDLVRATLIHSSNAVTWKDYFRRLAIGELHAANELWLDRSSMAIDAAVNGLGVILEGDILVEREMNEGKLVAPFAAPECRVTATSYYLVRPRGHRSGAQNAAFESWLKAELGTAGPVKPTPAAARAAAH
ncbi:LysR substrate-binding domain-containing protein [Aquabacter spiritensis]|uniref:LysR family glycine cleavage system transcriptional activator n=1 Tax=Aquabacter spiritensis TaxID=933073 RepID=A0A4R3LWN5_9HYPH|nr:LysR substrate-binding domain-containing protein [Aquabacter spiritensis]TCT02957.1 LysR family glycine cleavage system transcriptional activator [Aquabacter spiritensis]